MKNRRAKFKYGRHYHPRYVKDEMDEMEWNELLEFGAVDAPWGGGWSLAYEGVWYCTRNDDKMCLLMHVLKKIRRKYENK